MQENHEDESRLEELVSLYLAAQCEYNHWTQIVERLKCPTKPSQLDSLAALRAWQKQSDSIEREKAQANKNAVDARYQIDILRPQITRLIAVKGIWVRVGDYAVGYYYDVWGGGHYVLSIRDWQEELPILHDRTHYD